MEAALLCNYIEAHELVCKHRGKDYFHFNPWTLQIRYQHCQHIATNSKKYMAKNSTGQEYAR